MSESRTMHGILITTAIVAALFSVASCQAQTTYPQSAAQFGTAADSMFMKPYIDTDEWRDKPIRHRYVHGGFSGTDARFSLYFPPKEKYEGRFFQYVTPAPSSEFLEQHNNGEEDMLTFAGSSGAYFIETNEGGTGVGVNGAISGYRVNAAAARYSRTVAARMYGPHRTYGYVFGGSGGAFKTISGFENTDAWDGAVPYVIGSPQAIPNVFTARVLAFQVLWDKFPSIVDAMEPGGSGEIYAGLNDEEKSVLHEVTSMGFPPRSWYDWQTMGQGAFPILLPIVRTIDPTYFNQDFWTKPGYLGANPPPYLQRARIQQRAKVTKIFTVADPETGKVLGGVDTAWKQMQGDGPVALELENVPAGKIDGAYLYIKTGTAAGKDFPVAKIVGKTIQVGINPFAPAAIDALKEVRVGDEVQVDNSDFLAAQTYHRHQVSTPDFYVWDQFLGQDKKPLYPQRPMLIGPVISRGGAGSLQSGKFSGKMIVVESLMDQDALPWQADWYRTKVKENLGDKFDDSFRLWYTDHAIHGDQEKQVDPTQTVSYVGILQQALRDVSLWVEKGVPPAASTAYRVEDGQIIVPATAAQRHGIQPVVDLKADGKVRDQVHPGNTVHLTATIELPPNTGKVVSTLWYFEGDKNFAPMQDGPKATPAISGTKVVVSATHSFIKPGTYFPTVLVTSQRTGDSTVAYTRIHNLGRVRVVVQ